jgi:hypothetical protein
VTAGRLVASILERELDCGFIRLPHEGVPPEIKQSPFGPRRKRPELSMNCCTTTQKSSEGDGKYQSRNHKSLSRFQWAVRIGNTSVCRYLWLVLHDSGTAL